MNSTMNICSFLISLTDPVQYLRATFKEYAVHAVTKGYRLRGVLSNQLDYNCEPYFTELLYEMFNNIDGHYECSPTAFLMPSTQILIADGLTRDFAIECSLKIFNAVSDTISAMLPAVVFGSSENIHVGFCDDCDVLISIRQEEGKLIW